MMRRIAALATALLLACTVDVELGERDGGGAAPDADLRDAPVDGGFAFEDADLPFDDGGAMDAQLH